jgi:glycosyltransferase involved in cell wall biosynthesis
LGIPAEKVFIVQNGTRALTGWDNLRNSFRNRLGISETDVVIGYVGRLERPKRVDLLLRAVAELPEGLRSKARVVVIGGGSLRERFRATSVALGVDRHVTWTGEVARAESYMPAFDFFTLISDYEALPYALLEALSSGLPIVTTRVGGTSVAVKHNHNGFLLESRDISGLSRAIGDLVTNSALRSRMGLASKALSYRFSLDEMVRQTLDVYSKALRIRSADEPVTYQ